MIQGIIMSFTAQARSLSDQALLSVLRGRSQGCSAQTLKIIHCRRTQEPTATHKIFFQTETMAIHV